MLLSCRLAVAVGTLASRPGEFVRYKHHMKDGTDDFRLEFIEAGPIQITHAGDERFHGTARRFFDQARPRQGTGCATAAASEMLRCALLRSRRCCAHPEDLAGPPYV